MNGIVLLDEEQQRVLGSRQSMGRSPPPPPPRPRPVHMAPRRGSVQSEGQPRTDFTTYSHEPAYYRSDSLQKPSTTTYNSSPRTNFTTRTALNSATTNHVHGSGDGDSYPILHNHSYIASENGQSDEDDQAAAKYAGTSSGLRISVGYIMAGVAVGVILGLVFAQVGISTNAARWISLPGDLFLRALKCLVIPYVFCAVAVAIGDIVFVGKVSVVGMQTLRMFVFFWVASATIGTVVALSFRPLFRIGVTSAVNKPPVVGFTCPSSHGLVSQSSNGSIVCDPAATIANATSFFITDVNNVFVKTTTTGLTTFTLTDQLMSVITAIVSKNIIASFSNGDLLSIITFSMVLGAVAGRNYFTKSRRVNYLYLTLLQLRNAFFLALEWFIWLSPIAVVSLIAGSFATNADSLKQFDKMYVYVLAGMLATVLQMMVVFPLIVFLLTRCNPYSHMQQMLRAYMFAFACSSSLMTAPVTLACVKKAKVCSQSLGNFVISIGVCSNLSAVGIYIPIAIIFMAEASGNGDQITVLRIIGIFVLSVLACAGTPPIPSGVMVSISTFYTSIFGVSSPPADTLALVIAMDFIIDRFVTVCDVNDDIMCLKVIAENTDETVTQEQLGERE